MTTYYVKVMKYATCEIEAGSEQEAEQVAREMEADGFLDMEMDFEVEWEDME